MSSNIDEQFVEYVVKSLVGNPDAVSVVRTVDDRGVLLELTVDPEDLGRVIGKRGATAQSLRTLLRALGTKNDSRYNLKIVDNGPERPERTEHQDNKDHQERPTRAAPDPKPSNHQSASDQPAQDVQLDDDDETAAQMAEDDTSDLVSKTRKELEEFDDLDL
ncbi:MAG: KH domain-containing protein [Candidatus Saccharimonadales bacterium]